MIKGYQHNLKENLIDSYETGHYIGPLRQNFDKMSVVQLLLRLVRLEMMCSRKLKYDESFRHTIWHKLAFSFEGYRWPFFLREFL